MFCDSSYLSNLVVRCFTLSVKRSPVITCFVIGATSMLTGCSSQQVYYTGQAWQRNECYQVVNRSEQTRCLSENETRFEDYEQQIEAVEK